MTTVVNTPSPASQDSSGMSGALIAVIVLVVLVILFFVFGLPYLRSGSREVPTNVDVNQPNVNLPDEVDVNVNPPETGQ